MPTLDPRFVVMLPLQQVLHDKDTGNLLSSGVVTFYDDTNRTVLKNIYQLALTPSNEYVYNELNNPLTLSSIGSFVDDNGFNYIPLLFPYDGEPGLTNGTVELYYITVDSSNGVRQFTVEHWPQSGVESLNENVNFDNELANPQFVRIYFDFDIGTNQHTFDVTGPDTVTTIAPAWDLITSGTGTVTLKWVQVLATDAPTNPPYALDIQGSAGLTKLQLRQKLNNSPRLYANGYVSGNFIINSQSGAAHAVRLLYQPQTNGTERVILTGSSGASTTFMTLAGTVAIDTSGGGTINTSGADTGYINIILDIPDPVSHIQVSSFQITSANSEDNLIGFIQQSSDRQVDHIYHVDKPLLEYKPIPSLLVGWDFPLNPAQIGETGNIGSGGAYAWDQTICVRGSTNIAYARDSITGGIQFTTAGIVPDAFLMAQYLSGNQAKKILGTKLSVNINAYRGSSGGAIAMRTYLFRGSSVAVIPTLGNLIGTITTDGVFTKNNIAGQGLNWTEIPRSGLGVAITALSTVTNNNDINNGLNDYGFFGWEITDSTEIADTDKFCIIVTFSYAAINTVITVNSISCVPGDIPTRPAPQTPAEVLTECAYYYIKSFPYGVVPANNTGITSSSLGVQTTAAGAPNSYGPLIRFPTMMRDVPNVTTYNPTNTGAGEIYNSFTATAWGVTIKTDISVWGFAAGGTPPAGSAIGNACKVHWTADARLGIV